MSDAPLLTHPRSESTLTTASFDDPNLLPPPQSRNYCHFQVVATIGMCLSVYSALVLTVCPMWPTSPAFMKILAEPQHCSGVFYLIPIPTKLGETSAIAVILFVFVLFFISYWRSACTSPVRWCKYAKKFPHCCLSNSNIFVTLSLLWCWLDVLFFFFLQGVLKRLIDYEDPTVTPYFAPPDAFSRLWAS